jgi:hypothetical protein
LIPQTQFAAIKGQAFSLTRQAGILPAVLLNRLEALEAC